MRCTHPGSSAGSLLSPFLFAFDISTQSPFLFTVSLLIPSFIAKESTPFTLLSPSATFASFTDPSQDSSKAQSQSRYRSAISFKNSKHLLLLLQFPPYPSTLRHLTLFCHASTRKTLRLSKILLSRQFKGSAASLFPQP